MVGVLYASNHPAHVGVIANHALLASTAARGLLLAELPASVPAGELPHLAQTQPELREQLLASLATSNYSDAHLETMGDAMAWAYSALHVARRSGKSFFAHHVGAASCLLALNQPAHLVTAGLVHSAYGYGVLGGQGGTRPNASTLCQNRRTLAAVVGRDAEAIAWADVYFPSRDLVDSSMLRVIGALQHGVLTPFQRDVVLVHACNELDEFHAGEQMVGTSRLRSAAFQAHMVHLFAHPLVGASPAMAARMRSSYDATYARVNASETAFKRWGTLRHDTPPRLRAAIAALRSHNHVHWGSGNPRGPPHSELPFNAELEAANPPYERAGWDAYWARYEQYCCGEGGGPCPGG